MGIATTTAHPVLLPYRINHHQHKASNSRTGLSGPNSTRSMSQGFHQGIFGFPDGSETVEQQQQQQHGGAPENGRRDRLRLQGFVGAGQSPAGGVAVAGLQVPMEGEASAAAAAIYEHAAGAGSMLSEMFNFPPAGPSATDLLASQISSAYRLPRQMGFSAGETWYGPSSRQGMVVGGGDQLGSASQLGGDDVDVDGKQLQGHHQLAGLNAADMTAAAMQLYLMNPPPQQQADHNRSPSPPTPAGSSLHHHHHHHHQQHQTTVAAFPSPYGGGSYGGAGGMVEGRGLSLSLNSSLQAEDQLRMREGMLYYNSSHQQQQQQQQESLQQLHGQQGQSQQVHMGMGGGGGGAMGVVNVLRHSKYARAAQELLEEFCSVGRGGQHRQQQQQQQKGGGGGGGSKVGRHGSSNPNPNSSAHAAGASSSSSKDPAAAAAAALSPADKFEHQRRKAKLIAMLDEVDRRYNHYCDQMQMVVTSFDAVMGYGAATPYTTLAQKAMSKHFRCLKDAVAAQVRQACELLGDKDGAAGGSGLTKGETPRLKMLEQSLRQQRAFHQMGMMEQEAWRPQRGLPERSVNILRSWLFEHFLHPYPSDADKHLLARQTGLSRNQVTNWFINARVRLWKPMVEEMYQQEAKDGEDDDEEDKQREGAAEASSSSQRPQPPPPPQTQRPDANATGIDNPSQQAHPSSVARHHHHQLMLQQRFHSGDQPPPFVVAANQQLPLGGDGGGGDYSAFAGAGLLPGLDSSSAVMMGGSSTQVRFGAAGDVSLTLGLRHAGNAPEGGQFFREFDGGC